MRQRKSNRYEMYAKVRRDQGQTPSPKKSCSSKYSKKMDLWFHQTNKRGAQGVRQRGGVPEWCQKEGGRTESNPSSIGLKCSKARAEILRIGGGDMGKHLEELSIYAL